MSIQIFCPQCGVFIASQVKCDKCGWLRPVRAAQSALMWQAEVGGKAISLLTTSGLVCLGTTEGEILALRARDGRAIWRSEIGDSIVSGQMAVWNHLLIVGLHHGGMPEPQSLLALDLRSGREVWRFSTVALALSSPLVTDGIVYFTSSDGYLFALRASDGKQIWKSEKIGSNWSPAAPAKGSGRIFIGTEDRFVLAFDARTGKRSWTFSGPSDTCFVVSPTWTEGFLFAASRDGLLYALNAQDGQAKWNLRFESGLATSPVVERHWMLVGSRDGHLYALDSTSGKNLWEFKAERWVYAAPTIDVANKVVYCTSRDHRVYALELETGREIWRFESQRRIHVSPLLINGKVIFASFDRKVYALRAYQAETRLPAETYEQRKLYLDAAVEYALRGDFREAVRLFEQEQKWIKAAEIWKIIDDERQAARCYERGGKKDAAYVIYRHLNDVVNAARLAAILGRHREAAKLFLELGQADNAAEQFALAGDLKQAVKLYEEVQDWLKALQTYKQLGDRLQQAEMLVKLGRMAEAAVLFEGEGKKLRAAQAYENAGEVRKAAAVYESVGDWEKASDLFETLGEWEKAAEACAHLDNYRRTADAYKKAAEEAQKSLPVDRKRVASLWEHAASMYRQAADEGEEIACRQQIARYRKLPYISLQVDSSGAFFVGKSQILSVIVVNAGGSPAHNVVVRAVAKVGKVQSDAGELRGLKVDDSQIVELPILPDTLGKVRLDFEVEFSDAQNRQYSHQEYAYIEVIDSEVKEHERLDLLGDRSPSAIKILFLAANPSDATRLGLDEESRAIDRALRQSEFRDMFDVKQHWAVRVGDIQGLLLRHKPDIVHFSGHGSKSGEIILEDNSGNRRPVLVRTLSQLFSVLKDNIRCVVLNACYSEPQARAIAQHIDCVIGMSESVGDSAAISFSTAFYQALGYGRDVKTAFDLSCVQIDLENLDEQDVPKLLTVISNPEGIVFVNND